MEKEIVKRRTVQQARARLKRIKGSISGLGEIQEFIEDEDWRILGYSSYLECFDVEFAPLLEVLGVKFKNAEVRTSIHQALRAPDESGRQLTTREIAKRTGSSPQTVMRDTMIDPVPSGTELILPEASDLDIVDAEIVEESLAGKNLLDLVQRQNRENPGHQPQDTAEDAAKWIPALMESINADLDAVADWQEIGKDFTSKTLREELDILRDKISRIEAKL